MARLNKYMNSYDKQKWIQVMFIAEALDKITERTDLYNQNIINQKRKMSERDTFLVKQFLRITPQLS